MADELRSVPLPKSDNPARTWVTGFCSVVVQAALLTALSAGLLLFCFALFSRHNQFPVFYHPDEPSKVDQIRHNDRNFNHPQLMLETALWLMGQRELINPADPPEAQRAAARRLTDDQIVIVGRDGSAYLAAGAAVLLAWTGFIVAGWRGFTLVAIGAGLCPTLLAHSHYFKEEGALCFGVAAVIFVGAAMSRWLHWSVAVLLSLLLGAACGLAASGKYAGLVMLAPSILLVIMVTWWRWWILPICLALLGFGAWQSWSYINYRAIENWDEFVEGFEREKEHGLTDHFGITMDKPNGFFIEKMWSDAMPHVRVLVITVPFALLLTRRRSYSVPSSRIYNPRKLPRGQMWIDPDASPPRHSGHPVSHRRPGMIFPVWLILTLLIYTAAVSWSAIPFYRYIVPSTLLLYVLAAMGVVWLTDLIEWPRIRLAVLAICIISVAHLQAERCADHNRQFAIDSRDLLRDWVNRTVPRNAIIAADSYTELGSGSRTHDLHVKPRVNRNRWAAEMGSVSSLRADGYQYVAVAGTSYERFLDPHTRPMPGYERQFERNARFYRDLFENYPVVWQRHADHPMMTFANPNITLFRISTASREGPNRRRRSWPW